MPNTIEDLVGGSSLSLGSEAVKLEEALPLAKPKKKKKTPLKAELVKQVATLEEKLLSIEIEKKQIDFDLCQLTEDNQDLRHALDDSVFCNEELGIEKRALEDQIEVLPDLVKLSARVEHLEEDNEALMLEITHLKSELEYSRRYDLGVK